MFTGGFVEFLLLLIICVVFLLTVAALVGGIVALVIVLNKRRALTPRPGQPPKVCAACGAQNPPGYEFCDRCGARL
jgi:hypothetical protein